MPESVSLIDRLSACRQDATYGGDQETADFYQDLRKALARYSDEITEPALILLLGRKFCNSGECSCQES